jgi:hypothetical protein
LSFSKSAVSAFLRRIELQQVRGSQLLSDILRDSHWSFDPVVPLDKALTTPVFLSACSAIVAALTR